MSGDRAQGAFWILVGGAIFYASWTMDRLANLGVQPFSAPGLLPGILGVFIVLLGAAMFFRGTKVAAEVIEWRRLLVPIGLCLAFAAGLVGHGVPFWLAAWIFVTVMICTLQRRPTWQAFVIGGAAGVAIALVFQEVFLIRLP